jgi:hypothetical protein
MALQNVNSLPNGRLVLRCRRRLARISQTQRKTFATTRRSPLIAEALPLRGRNFISMTKPLA